jgi:Glycosyltransferase family 87
MEASPTRWTLIRRYCWIVVALILLFNFTVMKPLIQGVLFQTKIRDFTQEWASARNYFNGFPIYENQEKTLHLYLGYVRPRGEDMLDVNAHPPASVLLCLPFAALDYSTALMIWNLLSLGALAASIYLIAHELRIPLDRWSVFPILSLILLAAYMGPLRAQMEQGQWNLFLLLLFTGVWKCSRTDRPILAGVLLGLATAVKLFPGLLFIPFLLQRRWRLVAWGVVSFAAASLLTVGVLGLETCRTYLFEVLPHLERYRGHWAGVSFKGFYSKLFDPIAFNGLTTALLQSPWLARILTFLSSGLVLLFLVRSSLRARSQQEQDDVFSLTLIAMLLVSPIAWDHYILLLLLPLMYFWATLPKSGWTTWTFRGLAVLLTLHPYCYWWLLLCDPSKDWTKIPVQPWQTLTALSMHTYLLMGLFVFGLATFGSRNLVPARRRDSTGAVEPGVEVLLPSPLGGEGLGVREIKIMQNAKCKI